MSAPNIDPDSMVVTGATARAPPPEPDALARTSTRLRGCCQSCSRSKVRCTKEKPTCSRCEARGLTCTYLQSKRPGRVPGSGAKRSNAEQNNHRRQSSISSNASSSRPQTQSGINGVTSNPAAPNATDILSAFLSCPTSTDLDIESTPKNNHQKADSLFSNRTCAKEPDGLGSASCMNHNGDASVDFDWDDFSGVLSTMDNNNVYSGLMDWEGDLGPILSDSLISGSDNNDSASSIQTGPLTTPTSQVSARVSLTDLSSLENASSSLPFNFLEVPSGNAPSSMGNGHVQTSADDAGRSARRGLASTSCDCMLRALDLLKTLSGGPSYQVLHSSASILAQNKEYIQASLAILACHTCNSDRFVLMITHLIAMKILARYASAADSSGKRTVFSDTCQNELRTPSRDLHPEQQLLSTGNYTSTSTSSPQALRTQGMAPIITKPVGDEQTSSRETVHGVLRELHLVQRLIAQLSSRLKNLDSGTASSTCLPERPFGHTRNPSNQKMNATISNTSEAGLIDMIESSPLSTRTLDFVEEDVRKSLSDLSAQMRGALKNS